VEKQCVFNYGGNLSLRDSARSHQGGTQQLVYIHHFTNKADCEPGVAQEEDKHAEAVVADTVHDEEHHEDVEMNQKQDNSLGTPMKSQKEE